MKRHLLAWAGLVAQVFLAGQAAAGQRLRIVTYNAQCLAAPATRASRLPRFRWDPARRAHMERVASILETLVETGPKLVLAGVIVTSVPVLFGAFIGLKILKIHPVMLMGAITGSMTSGASLSIVTGLARSPLPALGYAGAYAFANILLTIAGSIILLF